jgi:integrase
MAAPKPKPRPAVAAEGVIAVIEKFLDWCETHRAAKTYEWYRWRLQLFAETIDRNLTVQQLRHFHLDEFLAKHPGWAGGMKHGACRAVQRAVRWAKRKGYTDVNPIADYEKPSPGKRRVVISPDEFGQLLSFVPSPNLKDLLVATWETAARPQESLIVEARHVDLENARWVFPQDEAKGEQYPRIVYLTERAVEITRRLMLLHPAGPIFRNERGVPWTPFAVNCAFSRIQVRMGLRAIQNKETPLHIDEKLPKKEQRKLLVSAAKRHARKYCLYHLRHSWLDRALKRGVDALTCAILMGHRDPSTIAKVYQHLSQSPNYLREAARKVAS